MAKQIELETVFSGEAARIFNEYIESPDHSSTPESRALIEKARRLAESPQYKKMPLNPDSFIFSKLSESSNVSSFICSEYSDLEEFLKDDAKNYHREKIATTYLVHSDDALIGYYSIAMGCVVSEQ